MPTFLAGVIANAQLSRWCLAGVSLVLLPTVLAGVTANMHLSLVLFQMLTKMPWCLRLQTSFL
jgi:hypothetical protein